jgi:hypothetical protein
MPTEYLVGILYHEPEPYGQWKRGLIEDYESSTGLFIEAESEETAIAWAEEVGRALLRRVNNDDSLDWKALGYHCWVEHPPDYGGWRHCLDFFQHVRSGEWPDLVRMATPSYLRWLRGRTHAAE